MMQYNNLLIHTTLLLQLFTFSCAQNEVNPDLNGVGGIEVESQPSEISFSKSITL